MKSAGRLIRRVAFFLISRVFPKRLTQFLMHVTQPKFVVAVVVIIYHGNRILLLRQSYRPRYPWGLVTGWVKHGENPTQAAMREVWEEIGLRVSTLNCFYLELAGRRHLEIGFWATVDKETTSQPSLDGEILESLWFSLDKLPDGLLPSQIPIILQAQAHRQREFS